MSFESVNYETISQPHYNDPSVLLQQQVSLNVVLFLKYTMFKNITAFKLGLAVSKRHWKCYQ